MPTPPPAPSGSTSPVKALVACLCAEWCGSCREYRTLFTQLTATFGGRAEFAWVDIEDHAEVLGDLDVDNFPTLLIVQGGAPRFYGAVTPHLRTAERLLQSTLDGSLASMSDPAVAALAERVRALIG